jgi:hypothetical protein
MVGEVSILGHGMLVEYWTPSTFSFPNLIFLSMVGKALALQ